MSSVTFESISVKIAAEAHRLVQQLSLSLVGSEYTNAVTSPPVGPPNVNPMTGLRKTCNNPSGTYCDTPIGEGLVCGASNHDKAHCFKPGGGMAGQWPSWQKGKGDKDKDKPTSAAATTSSASMPASPTSTSAPVAAAMLDPSVVSPWTMHPGDLTCAVITELNDDGGAPTFAPLPALKACLSTLSASSLLDSGTSCTLVCDHVFFCTYVLDTSVNVQTANHGHLPTTGHGECLAFLSVSGDKYRVQLTNCLHAPQAVLHLVSVGWMLRQGWGYNFQGDPAHCELSYCGRSLGGVQLQLNNLCFLD
ncbi:hypothetical protein M404DRAFT_970889, partial [Pisolithus tinctorius Marx 270]